MKDTWGDTIGVFSDATEEKVYVEFSKGRGEGKAPKFLDMALTPKKARKLARKLWRAANEINPIRSDVPAQPAPEPAPDPVEPLRLHPTVVHAFTTPGADPLFVLVAGAINAAGIDADANASDTQLASELLSTEIGAALRTVFKVGRRALALGHTGADLSVFAEMTTPGHDRYAVLCTAVDCPHGHEPTPPHNILPFGATPCTACRIEQEQDRRLDANASAVSRS